MPNFDPAPAARLLAQARAARGIVAPLPADVAPRSLAEGAAVQFALAESMAAVPPAGFKIGATARVMQEYLGLPGPSAGFMPATGVHASGAVLPYAAFVAPGVECEIAVRLAAALPPAPCTPVARRGGGGIEVFAAIEVVENRYGDLKALGTPTLIGDQVFHAACVLGTRLADWRAADLAAVAGHITVNGLVKGAGVGADLLGHPFAALAWLAGSAEVARFGGLQAGQVLMLGSVTPPIWLDGPCQVTVTFGAWAPVTLRFS